MVQFGPSETLNINPSLLVVGTKLASRKEPQFGHKGAIRDRCSLEQCRHFHPTPRGKESHLRHVMTRTKKGSEEYQGHHSHHSMQKLNHTVIMTLYHYRDHIHMRKDLQHS